MQLFKKWKPKEKWAFTVQLKADFPYFLYAFLIMILYELEKNIQIRYTFLKFCFNQGWNSHNIKLAILKWTIQ